jgi:hypothetical protein
MERNNKARIEINEIEKKKTLYKESMKQKVTGSLIRLINP